jgi:hypothetical protein
MINRGVWRTIKRSEVPKNRRLIGNKWVFKIKRNGVYRARLVALGYSQIPGVDFTDNFAPVIHDVTFRIILVRMMVRKLHACLVDVETAFLYGDLEEEIYMEMPKGYEMEHEVGPQDVCALEKSIYGLVQAAKGNFGRNFVIK